MKFSIAVIGCGAFARCFVPLFKAHPNVSKVYVCDILAERAQAYSNEFGVEIIPSFEEALTRKDVDAVAIFAQRHLHGPLAIAALKAGKHVYSAVPMASEVEQCQEIIELVKQTGLTYMMGETCIYYPCSMYCKQEFEKGTFGKFVFGESQYFHDISHFPADFKADLTSAGVPPFFYPTHSTAMLLNAVDSYVTRVNAMGYIDQEPDKYFAPGVNMWDNRFSNEVSLMRLANGGIGRVSECRRIGYKAPSSYISGFYGTEGSYQNSNAQHILTKKTETGVELFDVSAEVNPAEMTEHMGEADFKRKVANHVWTDRCISPMQYKKYAVIPESYKGLVNGHMASHQLLIHDFCSAVAGSFLPTVNAWVAARYTVPGLIAHESALHDGESMAVPDFGAAPEK